MYIGIQLHIMAQEVKISRVIYDKLLKEVIECSSNDIASGRVWMESITLDEKLGLRYIDSIGLLGYFTIYNFEIVDAKQWCFAKLKYNL